MDQNKEIKNKVVETYAEDMARVIGDNKGGLIKKIIHGEEEHEIMKRNLSPESKKNKLYMLFSILLVFLASMTLSYFILNTNVKTVPLESKPVPIIPAAKSKNAKSPAIGFRARAA